ncbi:DIS3-like exonuclease 2 isoform X2 [Ceratitis capitata]|uniref:DIS3-like exonuclease 2 isoform X2 n=1 Tax=Ceratitis capitata TaxID=7213 RepID=UPI000A110A10|nr:DIS3-like exonuclease 2 isoform X2 [Ceratitis capitata]
MEKDCGEDIEKHEDESKNVTVEVKVDNQGDIGVNQQAIDKTNKDATESTRSLVISEDMGSNEYKDELRPTLETVLGSSETQTVVTGTVKKVKNKNATSKTKDVGNITFREKIANLHEKTKNLRDKLGLQKDLLQNHATAVFDSPVTCQANDILAEHTMKLLQALKTDNLENSASTSAATQSAVNIAEKPQTSKTQRKRLSRRQLQDQVEGLQELVNQLTIKNPQLKECIQILAQTNPKLQQVKIFDENVSIKACGSTVRVNNNVQPLPWLKQRKESEISNASSNTSQKDLIYGSQRANQKPTPSKHKNKTAKDSKIKESELELLRKYLNMIVSEYMGPEQKEKAEKLEFKGNFEDLEIYAQKLVEAGIGRIVEEEIRINRRNNRQSFITMSTDREGAERDGIVLLPVARRYAFEGDIVRAFVMNRGASVTSTASAVANATNNTEAGKTELAESTITADEDITESPDSDDGDDLDVSTAVVPDNCPKSFVISIVKQTTLREVVGSISFKNSTKLNDEVSYYKLKPYDMRVPMVYIPVLTCVSHITTENKADICGLLYLAQIVETDTNGHCIGKLIQPVGKVGNMEAELKAILLHNGLRNIKPFEERFNKLYAQTDPPIRPSELHNREDWRRKCIFTIDPLTARDLDDAVSVESLGDDLYEIGVHISDVAHYLEEDSELDNIVKERATSIYLVNEVIHMLPKTLCFKCSLLPGEDKLAFSVFWQLNKSGDIIGQPRFSRTVINSCVQLAYEHAQKVIDNPNEEFGVDDFPIICNGFTAADICPRIKILNTVAEALRKKRFEGGALAINNPKIRFQLDPKTGEPLSYELESRLEANFLIEEFMLLANQSVARFIYDQFPDISILRNHGPPLSKSMKNLREKLTNLGMDFDCSSSKTVYASMQKLCSEAKDPRAMEACLSTLLTKPMARAKYFCSEGKSEEADLWHYALSIPIYTHFTSPIRRYPDILVHRVLAAALDYCPPPKRSPDELHMLAKICNDQKYNAKNAGDESINLFFKRYIREKQSITVHAVVTEIFQHLLNVVTIETGHTIAINYKMQKVLVDTTNVPAYVLIAERNSKSPPLKLQMFSTVEVKLVIWEEKICGFFVSPDPKQRQLNSIEWSKKKQQPSGSTNNSITESSGGRKNRRSGAETQTQTQQSTTAGSTKSKKNN